MYTTKTRGHSLSLKKWETVIVGIIIRNINDLIKKIIESFCDSTFMTVPLLLHIFYMIIENILQIIIYWLILMPSKQDNGILQTS